MDKLSIVQGTTYRQTVRWGVGPIIYKPITAIAAEAPARITCVGHGVPQGWPVAVTSVKGMKEINAAHNPPKADEDPYKSDYKQATIVDPDTIVLNLVNAASFSAYQSGGYVQYYTPVPLAGYIARMVIRDKRGSANSTEIIRLTTETGGIVINDTDKTITFTLTADQTADLTITKGVFDLELEAPDGTVTAIMSGVVSVSKEVAIG